MVRVAYGDPDAVSVGDYHVPNMVAWALAGEPRGDDARMLALLEPFRGHRGRVCVLLEAAGIAGAEVRPPRADPLVRPVLSRRRSAAGAEPAQGPAEPPGVRPCCDSRARRRRRRARTSGPGG